MNKLKKALVSPARIYLGSFIIFLVVFFIGIPAANFGNKHHVPFGDFIFVFTVYAIVLLCISIFTSVVYWRWFKKHWYINLAIAAGSAYFIDIYLLNGFLTGL
ncbi:hypothetical protein [Mucilaginibacter sp. L3T2-6]|uniref:hypothetical protein n=1 Tax=Mucilaginibacter sp. L3T2-6 TaxID=3062491 RepID=UPI0026770CCA|nr:hypothetical protein [Mucilaginibacter sp. L3T2-6]MDO3642589.1 hypothetical protein [Mucilaginibacter sp. L3T2-6]MDV6215015.1 hypothetical protein [Mucilaginibacter sp. L3T2-6]